MHLLCARLIAQISTDSLSSDGRQIVITEYYGEGLPKRIVYASQIEPSLSKADLFMRGIAPRFANRHYLIDSLHVFLKDGIEVEPTAADFDAVSFKYDVSSKEGESPRDNQHLQLFEYGQMSCPKTLFIEGKIGEIIDTHIVLAHQLATPQMFTILPRDVIAMQDFIKLLGAGEQAIPLRIPIGIHDKLYSLRFEDEQGNGLDLEIIAKGCDLTPTDFILDHSSHPVPFIIEDRSRLILKSDGVEKLIRLRQDDQVVEYFPYGQIRTEINLKGYQKGEYTLEAVDLRSNQVSILPLILR